MDLKCEMILAEYKEKMPLFKKIQEIVMNECKQFVKDYNTIVNSIESRIKTEKSLAGKLELKGYKYNSIFDITDIVGARIVTFYMDEIDKFAAKIEANFEIDWDNSIDKRKMHNIDQFGYMSLHYICSIPKTLYFDPNNPEINQIKFEIQLRSTLQHSWASITHDTGYKSDVEIPKEYLRSFSRLAGLLELADDLFCQLRNSIDDYRRRVKLIIKDGKFENLELNIDSFNAYLEYGGFNDLNKRIATIRNMDIEETSLDNFLKVFKSFNFKTLKDLDDLVKNYSELAYEFSVRQFADKDIDIISSATGPLALCIVFVMSKNLGEIIIKKVLDMIYGERSINERTAKRFMKIGYTMGLIRVGDVDE